MKYRVLSPISANKIRYGVGAIVELNEKQAAAAGNAIVPIKQMDMLMEPIPTNVTDYFDEPEGESENEPVTEEKPKTPKPQAKKK